MKPLALSTIHRLLVAACLGASVLSASASVTVNGTVFTLQELVGVGRLAANLSDEHGETFGSISGLVADRSSWTRVGDSYTGTFYAAPDRTLMAAAVDGRGAEFVVGTVEPLFELKLPYGAYHAFDVAADGQRILVNSLAIDPRTPAIIAAR